MSLAFYQLASVQEILPILSIIPEVKSLNCVSDNLFEEQLHIFYQEIVP